MEVILAGRGSHFEPAIVDAFEARQNDIRAISRTIRDK